MTVQIKPIADKDNQRAILLLEVAALLHDLGKLSAGFIQYLAIDRPTDFQFDYQIIADPAAILPALPPSDPENSSEAYKSFGRIFNRANERGAPFKNWPDLTSTLANYSFLAWDQHEYNLAELLLISAKGRGSETDWENTLGKTMQPALALRDFHGIAHFEKRVVESAKQPFAQTYRSSPFGFESLIEDLDELFEKLWLDSIEDVTTHHRTQWLAHAKHTLQRGIADNRRAINDVSLWDWGYIVATLFKPYVATLFNNPTIDFDIKDFRFRTLRVNLDTLGLFIRSDKITDLLGIRATLDNAFGRLQRWLEVECAAANVLYHDETGMYFLCADPNLDAQEQDNFDVWNTIQGFFPDDLKPQVHLGIPIQTRDLDPSGKDDATISATMQELVSIPRSQASQLREAPIRSDNNLFSLDHLWHEENRPPNAEICTVCHSRPVGYPNEGAESDEPELRDAPWATYEKARSRKVCRICLARRARRSKDWLTDLQDGIPTRTIWTDEVADDNGRLALLVGKLGLDDWLNGKLLCTLKADHTGVLKAPSPARLYHIAETARDFWQTMTHDITPQTTGQRPYRLAIYPTERTQPDLGETHAYELDIDGYMLSVVWGGNRFITCENLGYFVKRWRPQPESDRNLADYLRQIQRLDVYEPSEYLLQSEMRGTIEIEAVEELDAYDPHIPLLAEPGVCMILVPADNALALAETIAANYKEQMARVIDRLPMHLGLVFFARRTPIAAVMDAGRRMLEIPCQWQKWQANSNEQQRITFRRADRQFTHNYPVAMGDGKTSDEWYANLCLDDPHQHSSINTIPGTGKIDTSVFIQPSYFDFEFLDTATRRFEITYGSDGKRITRSSRPFLLDDLIHLEALWEHMETLAVNQRYQIVTAIETTREHWYGTDTDKALTDPVFSQYVKDTLAGANWPPFRQWQDISASDQARLITAGITGELADWMELHMEIMKEKEVSIERTLA